MESPPSVFDLLCCASAAVFIADVAFQKRHLGALFTQGTHFFFLSGPAPG
jgi:hypothetical protein